MDQSLISKYGNELHSDLSSVIGVHNERLFNDDNISGSDMALILLGAIGIAYARVVSAAEMDKQDAINIITTIINSAEFESTH